MEIVKNSIIDNIEVIYVKNQYSNRSGFVAHIISLIVYKIYLVFTTSTVLTIEIPCIIIRYYRQITLIYQVSKLLWSELSVTMEVLKNKLLIAISKWLGKIYFSLKYLIALSSE